MAISAARLSKAKAQDALRVIRPILFLDEVREVALKTGEVQSQIISNVDDHTDQP